MLYGHISSYNRSVAAEFLLKLARVVDNIQMEKWNGDVLDVNKTIEQLGVRKCSQLLGLHALLGCDTVSYPFGKGKESAMKLLEIDIPGLNQVLG